jgi:hypothetical protein
VAVNPGGAAMSGIVTPFPTPDPNSEEERKRRLAAEIDRLLRHA